MRGVVILNINYKPNLVKRTETNFHNKKIRNNSQFIPKMSFLDCLQAMRVLGPIYLQFPLNFPLYIK